MFASRSRIFLYVCLLLSAAAITLTLSLLLIVPDRFQERTWKGYYTLHIEQGAMTERLIAQIAESRRFQAVVSRFTAEASVNTFAGFVSVPIHRLPGRLDPLDPRFDPYMQRLAKLFTLESGTSWEVVYLRSDRNPLSTFFYLQGLLGRRDLEWRLIEFEPAAALIQVALLILYLLVLARMGSGEVIRLAALLAALPWVLLVSVSDFPALLAFFLVMPAWAHLFEKLYAYRYIRGSDGGVAGYFARPVAVVVVALGLSVVLRRPGPLAGLLLAAAGGAVAAAFLYCLFIVRDSLQAHRSFRALPILRRLQPRRLAFPPQITLHLILAFIVLCSFPLLRLGQALISDTPDAIRMHSIGDKGLSWRTLHALSDYAGSSGIPNLADYLAHRAYQESLIFGRSYVFPTPGERILISEYRIDPQTARIHKTFRVVKQFKESWLYATLEAVAPGSVARMFADQGFAGVVEITPAAEPVGRISVSLLMIILFLIQFLVPRYFNLTASVLYATRNLKLRRY